MLAACLIDTKMSLKRRAQHLESCHSFFAAGRSISMSGEGRVKAFGFGAMLLAGLACVTAAEAAGRKCDTATYAGRWLVSAGKAICTVRISESGRITASNQCYYGTTDRPISIRGRLRIDGDFPCEVKGRFRLKGGDGVLFDDYRMIAAGTGGTKIYGFLQNGDVVESFTLDRMPDEASQ
jgi:hypothetical protein